MPACQRAVTGLELPAPARRNWGYVAIAHGKSLGKSERPKFGTERKYQMRIFDIVRAWKDAEYRQSLSAEKKGLLPEHPAGSIELADEQLSQVGGGTAYTQTLNSYPPCIPDSP